MPGETDAESNPLPDYHLTKPQQEEGESDASYVERMAFHLNEVNDRNYSDLWFYSNPIFVWAQGPEAPTESDRGSSSSPSQSKLGTDTAPKPSHGQSAPQQIDPQPAKALKEKPDPSNQPALSQAKQSAVSIAGSKAKADHQANSQAPHSMGALATASHQPAEPSHVAKKKSIQSKLPQTGAYTLAGLGLSLVAIGSLLSFKPIRH